MTATDETAIKQQVIASFADDNIREDEIILDPDGNIIIDRRKTVSWAQPVVVGRWKS
ncbi:hypothetical protein [Actinomadura rubrisoli]|uniref:hypothetical protein n=1 Tax=Actinomadura rubrisoli TaxID=2530368 RepID=UPI001404BDAA|nr:hypothetical protein [Actinomadura rubrisoli]